MPCSHRTISLGYKTQPLADMYVLCQGDGDALTAVRICIAAKEMDYCSFSSRSLRHRQLQHGPQPSVRNAQSMYTAFTTHWPAIPQLPHYRGTVLQCCWWKHICSSTETGEWRCSTKSLSKSRVLRERKHGPWAGVPRESGVGPWAICSTGNSGQLCEQWLHINGEDRVLCQWRHGTWNTISAFHSFYPSLTKL